MEDRLEDDYFKKFNIIGDAGKSRGSSVAKEVLEVLKCDWEKLQEMLAADEDTKEELVEYFNGFDEQEQDLGSILFGDISSFTDRYKYLDEDVQDAYTRELKRLGVVSVTPPIKKGGEK